MMHTALALLLIAALLLPAGPFSGHQTAHADEYEEVWEEEAWVDSDDEGVWVDDEGWDYSGDEVVWEGEESWGDSGDEELSEDSAGEDEEVWDDSGSETPETISAGGIDDLQTYLAEWDASRPGYRGIVISDLASGTYYGINTDLSFTSASLYKLFVLAAAYQQIEAGILDFGDTVVLPAYEGEAEGGEEITVEEALAAVAQWSSNSSAYALIDAVGADAIASLPYELGLSGTHILTEEGDFTTAQDIADFFALAAAGQVVSPWVSEQILWQLAQCQINDRIPAGVYDGSLVAHKTGNMDEVVHDAGIVYSPSGPIIMVFLTQGAGWEATDEIRVLTEAAYSALMGG